MSNERVYLKMSSNVEKVINVLELSQTLTKKKATEKDYEDVLKTFNITRTDEFDNEVKAKAKNLNFL